MTIYKSKFLIFTAIAAVTISCVIEEPNPTNTGSSSGGGSGSLPTTSGGSGGGGGDDEVGDDTGGSEPMASLSEQVCEKYDECNFLGVGFSIADCAEIMENCVDTRYTNAAGTDWWNAARSCLSQASCGNFSACMAGLGACSLFDCHGECYTCNEYYECPVEWYGDSECDCQCGNFEDPDCDW